MPSSPRHATKSNVDGAAGVSVPDRVGDQVRERPIQLADVAGNGEGSVAVTAQLNALFGGQWLEGRQAVGDDVVEGNPFGCHGERSGLYPGELEQVVHHRRQPIDVGVHALVGQLRIVDHPVLQRLRHGPQAGERSAQVVANPRHELASRGFQRLLPFPGRGQPTGGGRQLTAHLVELRGQLGAVVIGYAAEARPR